MSNTAVRITVGIIGVPVIIFLAITGNIYFLVFCVVISLFCMNEFYNLFEKPKTEPSFATKWAGGFSIHKAVFLIISSLIVICFYYQRFNYVLILYFLMFLYLTVYEVVKTEKHFEAIGTWLLSIVYISTPFGLLSLMNSSAFTKINLVNYSIVIFILVWASDTFAYFGGITFGKHKLAERISPKKTWEGSIIGFIFTIITGIAVHFTIYPQTGLLHLVSISVIVGVSAQLGDLFESQLKRSVRIKDSSHLIPGHGGALDRFDSILFAVPAVYIYLYLTSIFK